MVFDKFVNIQAESITNLLHIFNPEKVIIGGEAVFLGDMFMDKLQVRIREKVMKHFLEGITIELSKIEEDSSILGASAYALQNAISIKRKISV